MSTRILALSCALLLGLGLYTPYTQAKPTPEIRKYVAYALVAVGLVTFFTSEGKDVVRGGDNNSTIKPHHPWALVLMAASGMALWDAVRYFRTGQHLDGAEYATMIGAFAATYLSKAYPEDKKN